MNQDFDLNHPDLTLYDALNLMAPTKFLPENYQNMGPKHKTKIDLDNQKLLASEISKIKKDI